MSSNLPPGVTDAMIDEHFGSDEDCERCGTYDECAFGHDPAECRADREAAEADRAYDAMKDGDL